MAWRASNTGRCKVCAGIGFTLAGLVLAAAIYLVWAAR
jgi:hypothetical protein